MSAVSVSTATATTVTADTRRTYRGRFAPSPSGALHLGSLAAALGSWLDARHNGGTWLIRIEDLDAPRMMPGAAEDILRTLSACGLESDEGPLLRQSQRTEAYAAAFEQLGAKDLVYPCSCSRRDTAAGPYAGTCRHGVHGPAPWAWRMRMPVTGACCFDDGFLGQRAFDWVTLGDPVVKRRDGLHAYQLAVVVDDMAQGITDIVRGADLLEATAWQLQIRQQLGGAAVRHAHLPLVLGPDGQKLSKSASAEAISRLAPGAALQAALAALRQSPPESLQALPVPRILDWALEHSRTH